MSLSVVVPIYNESENIKIFLERTIAVIDKINLKYEIIFVLDPSNDNSENIILDNIKNNSNIKLIKMSRRFGQPAAILAGIKNSSYDYAVLIDVDLQDPPELIEEMYVYAKKGFDTVLAERSSKIGENFLRKIIANIGYYLISKLSETKIPMNVGEFRMISRKIIGHICDLEEKDFFLRGANSYIGFSSATIKFDREKRKKGTTKYNRYTGSLKIGLNGIFSYSTKPLHFITILSSLSFIASSLIFVIYLLLTVLNLFVFKYQFFVIILILLVSSLIFFSQGIIAEYIARLVPDVKKRPSYIIDKKHNFDNK
jgi:glycosyltransferase involved in cell wall biosynthesis